MATIQAIEAKSVHQIQSGQVIVDLCSVVKELVENSLDAGASSIEVRFKNNGLDSIEIQDNGSGIAPSNYENIALKHYTSKLATYDDLSSLQTFGFRGEALSSLCALSHFSIITAQASEAPKGQKLEFEISGALKSTSTVASPKGTTVVVERLFEKLPVRRKELSKNIKREYGKVLGVLHAYACIGTNVKFTVRNAMPKLKSAVVFSTMGNATTKDNIANVYGAKTLSALIPLELDLGLNSTLAQPTPGDGSVKKVHIQGHISKPVFGEGRQTPDRQMFFVNGRPCGLPQIAKAINEVYKSFNVSQSPFVFADFRMDTNAYDVNVSPDKRSIMLHNATMLIEQMKKALSDMFDQQDQTVPQTHIRNPKLPAFRQLTVTRHAPPDTVSPAEASVPTKLRLADEPSLTGEECGDEAERSKSILYDHFRAQASTREEPNGQRKESLEEKLYESRRRRAEKIAEAVRLSSNSMDEDDDSRGQRPASPQEQNDDNNVETPHEIRVRDFNARMAEQQVHRGDRTDQYAERPAETPVPSTGPSKVKDPPGIVQNALDRMRPKKTKAQIAEITIGDETTTAVIGTQLPTFRHQRPIDNNENEKDAMLTKNLPASQFSQKLQRFEADNQPEDHTSTDAEAGLEHASSDGDSDANGKASNAPDSDEAHSINGSDSEYVDDEEKKKAEEARVAELIRIAEESSAVPSKESLQRANKALKGGQTRNSTTNLLTVADISLQELQKQGSSARDVSLHRSSYNQITRTSDADPDSEEERLSLTVSKNDFVDMEIVGQFNLGFIIAVRRHDRNEDDARKSKDELFIIDQHASDEKYNFERLQAETTVGNQRMVRPVLLNLTAVEEEVVLENTAALEQNGFVVELDTTGHQPVGQRCTLVSLPLSKEVVFDTRDLEELIHLLSESPMLDADSSVPRPSRVRKMFAMRACRSSIMIGKTLSKKQMMTVVSHMGTIDKPWNCPHGRPTMRHLTSLDAVNTWEEGDGVMLDIQGPDTIRKKNIWLAYL